MSKGNLRKQKNKSKLQIIFDEGVKFVCKSFIALSLHSPSHSFSSTVIASKKIGGAVKRNRSKRRLREIIRLYIKPKFSEHRIIFIARNDTASIDYSLLQRDCHNLIKKIS